MPSILFPSWQGTPDELFAIVKTSSGHMPFVVSELMCHLTSSMMIVIWLFAATLAILQCTARAGCGFRVFKSSYQVATA